MYYICGSAKIAKNRLKMAFGGVKLTLYVNKPDKKFYGLRQISSKTGSRRCSTLLIT